MGGEKGSRTGGVVSKYTLYKYLFHAWHRILEQAGEKKEKRCIIIYPAVSSSHSVWRHKVWTRLNINLFVTAFPVVTLVTLCIFNFYFVSLFHCPIGDSVSAHKKKVWVRLDITTIGWLGVRNQISIYPTRNSGRDPGESQLRQSRAIPSLLMNS